ncbi:steroidogenic factor 1b isoform X1 [Hippoglossus hippoglossus]|nr:steroidogenic factor 1b isoform X1 [Hippoglossus hippoglossus]XP_034997717.2 nuclear receptor subfamily 5 group A member 2 isoform X2 [Hippoglossus stenolepis]
MEFRHFVHLEEHCPICGDKVSGYHYGLLTCESCKGFFKRTVQNNKTYICAENQACSIDKTQRKRCPFCRFQKCLQVGMRLEAVRADRMRGGRNKFGPIYKQDRALKQRKALIQACGFRSESRAPLIFSKSQRVSNFTGGLQPESVLHSTLVTKAQNDCISYLSPPLLPSSSPCATKYQCFTFSNSTITPEHTENCTSSQGSAAGIHTDSDNLYSSSPQGPRMPQLVIEFLLCDLDQLQLQKKVTTSLQQEMASWRKHRNPTTFTLMCLMADQMVVCIVEWARTSIFFKHLKVCDQMKLLHNCWSELLILDIISGHVLYNREGSLLLVTGLEVQLSDIASPTLANLLQSGQELIEKLHTLKVDRQEFACIKFLILFNPDVKELEEHQLIESVQEQAEGALLEYTLCTSSQHLGRFTNLLLCLSELRALSILAEDYLYCRHLIGEVPCNNLLTEMLRVRHSLA